MHLTAQREVQNQRSHAQCGASPLKARMSTSAFCITCCVYRPIQGPQWTLVQFYAILLNMTGAEPYCYTNNTTVLKRLLMRSTFRGALLGCCAATRARTNLPWSERGVSL